MKNQTLPKCRTTYLSKSVMKQLLLLSFILLSAHLSIVSAQGPKLSIQGILKKTSGDAVPDGSYSLTFKLYTVETGGTAVWTEMQSAVDVISGIYSTVLGNTTPLTISFNQVYYLGVTVGSTEMTPRIQLTSAPYALSLIGVNNQFPSSGQVIADSIDVNGNVLARSGAPGLNGINKNGYGFLGDKDSGMYSTSAGQVSLYVNKDEQVKVTPDSVRINGDISLQSGKTISYNGLDDWRLVETDYFENVNDAENWKVYNPVPLNGPAGAWSNGTGTTATVTNFNDDFAGRALVPTAQGQVFKKLFTLPGSNVAGTYTYVKVVFKYFFLNSWDLRAEEVGWAGFSKTENCTDLSLGWLSQASYVSFGWNLGGGNNFANATNFVNSNNGIQYSEQWKKGEMIARFPSGPGNNNFYVIFGHASDEAVGTENFGVGMIEIWVK